MNVFSRTLAVGVALAFGVSTTFGQVGAGAQGPGAATFSTGTPGPFTAVLSDSAPQPSAPVLPGSPLPAKSTEFIPTAAQSPGSPIVPIPTPTQAPVTPSVPDPPAQPTPAQSTLGSVLSAPAMPSLLPTDLSLAPKRSNDALLPEDAAKTPTYPKIKLTGFFQADAAWFMQDSKSRTTFGDIQDDRGFRRARLAASGDVAENVSYMLEMDFAFPGRPSFMDVWLELHKIPLLGNVRVGQYRTNFGMDELTSVRELTFLERGIVFGMAPFRQLSVGFHDTNPEQTMTWAVDGFGFPTDFFGDSTGDRGYGATGRITTVPFHDPSTNGLVHLGANYGYLNTSTGFFRFRNQPEYGGQFGPLNLGNTPITNVPFFIDTGAIPAGETHLVNAEFAMSKGSAYLQSELRYAFVHTLAGGYVSLPAGYAQVGYFLTGEQRPYNKKAGVFGRVKPLNDFGPCCGAGAWEVAFRYSYANFQNKVNPGIGNELNNTTLGVNWYLNQYAKFQFNWIHAATNPEFLPRGNTDIFAIRAQLDF